MDEEELDETVRREAPLESEDVARDLPEEFRGPLVEEPPGEAEPSPIEEFRRRVSDRAGVDENDVVAQSRAVKATLEVAAGDELATAREQFEPEYDVVFEPGGPITADEFLESIRERADLESRGAAEDATRATLRTLRERLSGGESADLAHYLPDELAEPLHGPADEVPEGSNWVLTSGGH